MSGSGNQLVGDATGFNSGVYLGTENRALSFTQPDYVEVPASAFTAIDSFITVEFWCYGDPNAMPSNSYAFEGKDANGNRVINSHLPWSNSRVYWDAGNSGGGAYDRIDLAANFSDFAGQWNHWAFVKDVSSGEMHMYLNGSLFHSGTGLTRTMSGITSFRIAAPATSPGRYDGTIDEFRVWDAALTQSEIQNYLFKSIDPSHPNYSNLVLEYGFNELTGQSVLDASPNTFNGTMMGLPARVNYSGIEHNFNMLQSTNRPNITLVQGIYTSSMDSVLVVDSVEVDQISITEQSTSIDINQTGITYTNVDTIIAYPGDFWTYTYDPYGNAIDSSYVPAAHSLINTLKPITHQIQNYVTPYGIGLDLGPNGFRWVYDVTDYIPLLRDTLEISAGNQQELIDLKFLFIEGTPPRDIIDFETIWTGNYSHANIANDVSMPAVTVDLDPSATHFSLKTRATGHWFGGFENCAEFCPKLHNIKIDGTKEFEWMVWKECANNPVVDQGGTWVYDRAGWCPGTFANTYDYEITPFVTPGSSASIDYGMQTTAGGMEGNYWVSLQMVSYGDINFVNDAEVVDILAPNTWEYHNRLNPVCSQPIIKIRNSGSDTLRSLDIKYRVEGGQDITYQWTGELAFLEEDTVYLHPMGDWFWFSGNGNKVFEVECENPNGLSDENPNNDIYKSQYEAPVVLPSHFYFWIQSNNAAAENAYYLMDWQGDTIFSRDNWTNATTYRDTFLLADGCYTMKLIDRDHDGLSFFANSDGNGQFRWKGVGAGTIYTLENNFGDELTMHFTVGGTLSDNLIDGSAFVNVYPNPSNTGWFKVDTEGFYGNLSIDIVNAQGALIKHNIEKGLNGSKLLEIDLSHVAKGIYFLQMTDGNVTASKRLIIN